MKRTVDDPLSSDMLARFAVRLGALRRAAGLRQEDLAEKVGRTRSAVDSWEDGAAFARPPELKKMKTLFGVDVDFILYGETAGLTQQAMVWLTEKGILPPHGE